MYPLLPKNFGFGLGFATRELKSSDSWYGEEGDYFWLGYAGTNFLISPKIILYLFSWLNKLELLYQIEI